MQEAGINGLCHCYVLLFVMRTASAYSCWFGLSCFYEENRIFPESTCYKTNGNPHQPPPLPLLLPSDLLN